MSINEYEIREDCLYTGKHIWVKVEKGIATIGISDYAQKKMQEILTVELPHLNERIEAGEIIGSVGSIDSALDIISPVSGKIIDVNEELLDNPELINESPYDRGWIVKIEMKNEEELYGLMDHEDYRKYIEEIAEE
ncbi:MAG: glycine cleavage system protein GcvH [Nitrososphaerota archaeon]